MPLYVPKTGTIKSIRVTWRASTAGSGESISAYVRVNNTADTLIAAVANTSAVKLFANAAMSVAVTAGDTLVIKIVTPTWATNPATLALGAVIYVEA